MIITTSKLNEIENTLASGNIDNSNIKLVTVTYTTTEDENYYYDTSQIKLLTFRKVG